LPASNYSRGARWLHRIALGNDILPEVSFDIERALFARHAATVLEPPVLIAGLARGGTTLLMRLLHDTGHFASLTYRDMPFVLAPNLWARISSRSQRAAEAQPRAHGDGLTVSADSPEALEEVFWRVHCRDLYLGAEALRPMTARPDVLDKFRQYVRLVALRQGKSRYLSKNNNNILRLRSLRQAFPDAVILVPFRHPRTQSESLLSAHRRFIEMQGGDPFTGDYMGWLVHHEFGGDHRPFLWTDDQAASGDYLDTAYWLRQWHTAYTALIGQARELDLKFLCYESLCRDPGRTCESLARIIGTTPQLPGGLEVRPLAEIADSSQVPPETMTLYERLTELSLTNSSTAAT
jgi:hypothetical protein